MNCVEGGDALQLTDRFLKRRENLGVTVIVIEIDDRVRQARYQLAQDLALHGCEVEEAVDDEELDFRQPRHRDSPVVDHSAQNPERTKLIGVFFGEVILVQQVVIS